VNASAKIPELVLLIALAATGGIFAWALGQWLFGGILAAEAVWAIVLVGLLLEPD
jgi:hypothetical protein